MKALSSFLFFLILCGCLPAPSAGPQPAPVKPLELAGVLSGETVLAGEVLLTGDVLVPEGSTLLVRPGTTVYVRPSESTKIDPEYLSPQTELLVRGTLLVAGTAEEPVRFLPLALPEGEDVGWAGILLDGAAASRIEGARISQADTGILCLRTAPLIRNNRLHRCRYGIVAQERSAPRIVGNRIEDGEGGIFCWWRSNPFLLDNRITGHEEEGIFVDASSRPLFARNVISGNAIGLALYPRDLSLQELEVSDNREDLRLLGANGGGR